MGEAQRFLAHSGLTLFMMMSSSLVVSCRLSSCLGRSEVLHSHLPSVDAARALLNSQMVISLFNDMLTQCLACSLICADSSVPCIEERKGAIATLCHGMSLPDHIETPKANYATMHIEIE